MKFIINPKCLFRSKKSRDVSKSNPSSFSYGAASSSSSFSDSSSSSNHGTKKSATDGTPMSVFRSHNASSDWSDFSSDIHSELVHAFKLIDRDGDGKISRIELEALLNRVGSQPSSQEELATMLSEVDHDGDGRTSMTHLRGVMLLLWISFFKNSMNSGPENKREEKYQIDLMSIISSAIGKDPLLVLDEAIIYLKSLLKAKGLGHGVNQN